MTTTLHTWTLRPMNGGGLVCGQRIAVCIFTSDYSGLTLDTALPFSRSLLFAFSRAFIGFGYSESSETWNGGSGGRVLAVHSFLALIYDLYFFNFYPLLIILLSLHQDTSECINIVIISIQRQPHLQSTKTLPLCGNWCPRQLRWVVRAGDTWIEV